MLVMLACNFIILLYFNSYHFILQNTLRHYHKITTLIFAHAFTTYHWGRHVKRNGLVWSVTHHIHPPVTNAAHLYSRSHVYHQMAQRQISPMNWLNVKYHQWTGSTSNITKWINIKYHQMAQRQISPNGSTSNITKWFNVKYYQMVQLQILPNGSTSNIIKWLNTQHTSKYNQW